MYLKRAGFTTLFLAAFCLFTTIFHSTVNAAESTSPISPLAKEIEFQAIITPKTPKVYFTSTFNQPDSKNALVLLLENDPTKRALQKNMPKKKLLIKPASPVITSNQPGGLDAEKLFAMANAHRQSLGLTTFVKDERTCNLAAARAPEIAGEMAKGTLHSGMYGRKLPYWNTENAIAMGTEEAAFQWWLNEPIHRKAIEDPRYTVSCTACSGVYCVQEFTAYQPK